jgi:hypothetical protein
MDFVLDFSPIVVENNISSCLSSFRPCVERRLHQRSRVKLNHERQGLAFWSWLIAHKPNEEKKHCWSFVNSILTPIRTGCRAILRRKSISFQKLKVLLTSSRGDVVVRPFFVAYFFRFSATSPLTNPHPLRISL